MLKIISEDRTPYNIPLKTYSDMSFGVSGSSLSMANNTKQ